MAPRRWNEITGWWLIGTLFSGTLFLGTLFLEMGPVGDAAAAEPPPAPPPATTAEPLGGTLTRITKDYDVWIDMKRKLVVVDGEVALREGPLELFACPKGTKEHEAIVAVNSKAQFIHAALLAVGAKSGQPAEFSPMYRPASGTRVDVQVLWTDAAGKRHQVPAQSWIRRSGTEQTLDSHWVFAGSSFWTDEASGEKHYSAEAGDFICVSNFPTAMLDLPVVSSQANADLAFEAFTDRIPPRGTKVRLVLRPRLEAAEKQVEKKVSGKGDKQDKTGAESEQKEKSRVEAKGK